MNWGTKIIISLGIFMSFILGLSFYMMSQTPELEENDYYEKDLAYQQNIDARDNQVHLGQSIKLVYSAEKQEMSIVYPDSLRNINGKIIFNRPSDSKKDFESDLKLDSQNHQVLKTNRLDQGLWKVKIIWQMREKKFESQLYEIMI